MVQATLLLATTLPLFLPLSLGLLLSRTAYNQVGVRFSSVMCFLSLIFMILFPLVLQDQFSDVFVLVRIELSEDLFIDIACGVTLHFFLLLVGTVFG